MPARLFALIALLLAIGLTPFRAAHALPLVEAYTNSSDFHAALAAAGYVSRQTFTFDTDATPAGLLLPQPTSADPFSNRIPGLYGRDLTLGYNRALAPLMVSDRFDTTSGDRYLGTSEAGNYDQLVAGDRLSLLFGGSINALGLFFITADPLLPGDILLQTSVGSASNSANPEFLLSDGGMAYFIGLTSGAYAFGGGVVQFNPDATGTFLYNIDNIEVARLVPEPDALLLCSTGLVLLVCVRRRSPRPA